MSLALAEAGADIVAVDVLPAQDTVSQIEALGFQGGIRVPSYTASKSAVAGLTRLIANELASKQAASGARRP